MKSVRALLFAVLAVAMFPFTQALPARAEVDVYTTPGTHNVNGRQWQTSCEPYSQTERCRTYIWATTVVASGSRFIQQNSWVFNNLTYKSSPRSLWAKNPLGIPGEWTAADGRDWRTECDNANTGRNGCRSYARARVVESFIGSSGNRAYRWTTKWVFNNMVRFGPLEAGSPGTPGTPGRLRLPTGGSVMADRLDNPWSLVFVGDQPLFTQRDRKTISTIVGGQVSTVLTISAVHAEAEGGLLGLAHTPARPNELFVYYTTGSDNRVVRYQISGSGSSLRLSNPRVLLSGIPKARAHNGGRIAFGPDGKLYVATGDAGQRERSQQLGSLAGKILRINPNGTVPSDNPFGTAVWSYGHRNVQGLAWADDGTMWASELGQDSYDELNKITRGGNYGWPVVEGAGNRSGFINPVVTWRPSEASPSGLLWKDKNLYMAALRGERMWVMLDHDPVGTQTDVLEGSPGRLRDVVAAPDGSIWVLTSNNSNDRIIRYTLTG